MLQTSYLFALVLSLLMLSGCDLEKYTSASLSQTTGRDSSVVEGYVLRAEDGNPVTDAQVTININRTYTDAVGFFKIGVTLGQDENRNLPVPVIVRARKFLDYYGQEVILPTGTEFEIYMTYRPPVVKQAALIVHPLGVLKVLQARVRDAEGVADIHRVAGKMMVGTDPKSAYEINPVLEELIIEDENAAFFQSRPFNDALLIGQLGFHYSIITIDNQGFADTTYLLLSKYTPDTPIYPVQWP